MASFILKKRPFGQQKTWRTFAKLRRGDEAVKLLKTQAADTSFQWAVFHEGMQVAYVDAAGELQGPLSHALKLDGVQL